jgi:hypothetical protein
MDDEQFKILQRELRTIRDDVKTEFKELREENRERHEQVIRIEEAVKALVGNGKKGRIDDIETAVEGLREDVEAAIGFIDKSKGALKVLSFLGITGAAGIIKHIFFPTGH